MSDFTSCLSSKFSLGVYTQHGEYVNVPDLTNVPLEEAGEMLNQADLGYEVIDSAAFNELYLPFAVIEQFPKALAEVKSGRIIKLTITE